MSKLYVDTNAIRAELRGFGSGKLKTFDIEDVFDALFELDRLRTAVVAYLENDSDANWQAMATLADPDGDMLHA